MSPDSKKNVLFVDDEPEILAAIQDSLEPFSDGWRLQFASGGEEALELLNHERVHVLVTDLQMPGMDGAHLLAEARRRHPETARVVMSGYYDKETALRLVCATHQYLPKPCEAGRLSDVITRILRLRDLLTSETLQRLVTRIKSLPSMPTVYVQLMEELGKDDPELEKIGQIISRDPAMSAKILQLVNSAYFGLSRDISHPSEATMFLGVDLIRGLVLMAHVFTQFDKVKMDTFSIERVMEHSWLTGVLARAVAMSEQLDARSCDHAFIAGLLHDIGKLILVANLPQLYLDVVQTTAAEGITVSEAEADVIGCNHAEVGAYLIGLWGLPDPVVEGVAFHNRSIEIDQGQPGIPTIVYLASELEKLMGSQSGPRAVPEMAADKFRDAGVADRLQSWWDVCETVLKRH
ncbi:MAG TPA: hypothetical protein DCY13_16260 [Verrucomicrobiales bacterium]|nr:hypothetical protein [Verrucomicrobiales bacterium]